MSDLLAGKRIVVVGASQGIGREIVAAANAAGAQVLAVARRAEPLAELATYVSGAATISADATDESTPDRVFAELTPDVLILSGGGRPVMAPVQELDWEQFSSSWNADVKASFLFCKAALQKPLAPGSVVILISSGAALAGSHLSGSYAGAKRTQMFLADYCQRQSDQRQLGIRFLSLVPMRMMPGIGIGKMAVAGYSKYLGITEEEFINSIELSQTPEQVVDAAIHLASAPPTEGGNVFGVWATGIEAIP